MASTNLVEVFNVKKRSIVTPDVVDYDVFPDKNKLEELRSKIIQNLIDNTIPKNLSLEQYINDEIDDTLQDYDLSPLERNHIFNLIQNEINGYGPLTDLLENDFVTEIMVNGINDIYVEIDGKLVKDESVSFINETHIIRTIQRIVQPLGRTIDASNPMVDARLKDGSRLNAIIPPLSLTGPVVTIRKFSKRMESIDDLLRMGSMTAHMAMFLEACVKAKFNIIISGGTGSGKTTLLNILSSFISDEERIITIEDAAELRLHQSHVISLETRMVNYEGEGEITVRDLVRNSLRMRPDRIIVGEVRGKESFDMLQAMNTGHSGMSTGHGNSIQGMLKRLETMYLMEASIDIDAIRRQISEAIDVMIHIEKQGNSRKVVEVAEVIGYENGIFVLNTLVKQRVDGKVGFTGNKIVQTRKINLKGESSLDELRRIGIELL